MENASQALLIAGGILIGILTITLLVYMFGNLSTIETARDEESNLKRIKEWNAEWEAYNKENLRGADVLTVLNKAENNNLKEQYIVNVEVYSDNRTLESNPVDFVKTRKTNIFTCITMEDTNNDARIDYIKFKYIE